MRLEDGSVIFILEVVRIVWYLILVKIYLVYCEEIEFIFFFRFIFYYILCVCFVLRCINLKGFDNIVVDGGNFYDVFLLIVVGF